MMRRQLWIVALLGLFVSAGAIAGEAARTGVVKGTITIGGRPTSDAVVSVEGLAQEKLKTQNSKLRSKQALVDQRNSITY
jgi:hypothetical protein